MPRSIGTTQDSESLYYEGFDPSREIDPNTVKGYSEALDALSLVPVYILMALTPQWNEHTGIMEEKAIYFSSASGRGYSNIMPRNYSETVLRDVYTGIILEQGSSWTYLSLHELGHIIDFCGIRATYYWRPIWDLAPVFAPIFDSQGKLISDYANANPAEDFAEHFVSYIVIGATFRGLAIDNPDLSERYGFLRDKLFLGQEYQDILEPPITPPLPPPTPDMPPIPRASAVTVPIILAGLGLGVAAIYTGT